MKNTFDVRVGNGFDVHAIQESGSSMRLGGIDVPTNISLIGHSDADVVLHSITDALLGTIGDGDIGQHFSPNDDQWKGADSAIFLKFVCDKVLAKGGFINHVDVTIIGEKPKISPYRMQMVLKIAEIIGIDSSKVSVKATTTEKLGFCGRGEGIACQSTATVIF